MGILETKQNPERPIELFQFTQGIEVDRRLAFSEIKVQKAWAKGLCNLGILTQTEVGQVDQILGEAQDLISSGQFHWRVEDEDVHMNLERFVTEKAGALGKRMHLGRSRNDLIATTLRVFTAEALEEVKSKISKLILAMVTRAEKDVDQIMPGMTHLQNGQPVRYSHVLLSHAWGLARDLKALHFAASTALSQMPLGSAALSGTPLAIDLDSIARELNFETVSLNSYDSVGDRDFMIQALSALSGIAVHLSRFSEDTIIWSSSAVGLVKLPKKWSTGSSIMPNKRNPDVAELTRAKSAHVMAAHSNALTLMKGLPTSYDSDLHELKSVLMRGLDELNSCLEILPHFASELEFDSQRAKELLERGHLLATEIADELADKGVPFREAYSQVAALVQEAEKLKVQVHELRPDQFLKIAPVLKAEFMKALTFESAVERRKNKNGTARMRVAIQIKELRALIKAS